MNHGPHAKAFQRPVAHIIYTRFNLRFGGETFSNTFNDAWMKERIALFKAHTMPSVLGQVEKNFSWVILFDEERSLPYADFLDEIDGAPNCFVAFADGVHDMVPVLRQHIASHAPAASILASTRLDSDDVLHPLFTQDVQAAIDPDAHSGYIVDFPFTETVDVMSGQRELKYFHSFPSPFYTYIEANSDEPHIGVYNHTKIPDEIPVRNLNLVRTTTIVHGGNLLNQYKGFWTRLAMVVRRKPARAPLYCWMHAKHHWRSAPAEA
ncbi:MAG: glycosyltransferase [Pseudomonadota bacterium]